MKPTKLTVSERAVGAAAAAVFLAGVVSAGMRNAADDVDAPTLATPASTLIDNGSVTRTGSATTGFGGTTIERLMPARLPSASNIAGGTSGENAAGAPSVGPSIPSSPSTPRGGPNPPPDSPPAQSESTPSIGVAVGPIGVGASPAGAGADVAGTPVGDQTSVPDESDGVTVHVDTGVTDPVDISLP